MILLQNVNLKEHTSFRMGGIAENFYIPQNREELLYIVKTINSKIHFLSNGTNLIVNEKGHFKHVVSLKKVDSTITSLGNGLYEVGASVNINSLINKVNKDGYGGVECLYGIPGLIGAAVAMNAGTGKKRNKYIGDYVKSVTCIINKSVKTLNFEECRFSYRNSIFKENNYIILKVTFQFPLSTIEEIEKIKSEKRQIVHRSQDRTKPSVGSIFNFYNKKLLRILVVFFKPLFISGARFSKKNINWINNYGNAKYTQIKFIVTFVILVHKILGHNKIKTEIVFWKGDVD